MMDKQDICVTFSNQIKWCQRVCSFTHQELIVNSYSRLPSASSASLPTWLSYFTNYLDCKSLLFVTLKLNLLPVKLFPVLTSETWSCTRLVGNTACSPSAPGPRRRSCRRCGHSWRSRSWWRPCPGSAARWGSSRTTAPSSPPPWGWALDWRLWREGKEINNMSTSQGFFTNISI